MRPLRSITILFALCLGGVDAAPTPTPAVADAAVVFAARPLVAAIELSPNGKHLAILRQTKTGSYGLYLFEIDTGKARQLISPQGESEVASVRWLDDDWLTFEIGNVYGEYGGYGRLDIRATQIVQDDGWFDDTCIYMDPASAPPRRNGTAWMMCRGRDGGVVRVQDLKSGKLAPATRAPGAMSAFTIDHLGQVRAAVECTEHREGRRCVSQYRENDLQEFRAITAWWSGDAGAIWPAGFDADDRTLFVYANPEGGPLGVYRWDGRTRQLGEKVFSHPEFDVAGIVVSLHDRKVVGVRYNDGLPRVHWIDAARAALEREIAELFPDESVTVEFNDQGDRALVFVHGDRNPGEWHLYLPQERELRAIGKRNPAIDPARMAKQEPISFKARDGLVIHGYLTRPAGAAAGPLPMVVYPHGGPFYVRDTWGFDPELQFLASLGYAVLQLNFRGSAGYGEAFAKAGWGQWGLKMQDDVTDGVLWAIERGIAERDRICIHGASYGGYTALMGLIKTPDLYRCGVAYASVTDLVTLYRDATKQHQWLAYRGYADLDQQRRNWFRRMIGGDLSGAGALSARSPVDQVDRIRVPVFIVHGRRDRVAPFWDHARVLRHELEKRGRPFDWLEVEEEGHGFRKPENVAEYYRRLGAFLDRNLTPRAAAEPR